MSDMPIWLLNLERSHERRAFMTEQFSRMGLAFETITGVDGQVLTAADLALYSRKDALRCSERELIPGEIGCAISHARIWQRVVDENIDKVLVFEDDILIGNMMPQILVKLQKFPADWEMINFVTDYGRSTIGDPICDIHRVCIFDGYFNRLGAYLLNRRGAAKLLEHVYPIRWPADGLTGLTHITGLIAYGVDPQVAAIRGCHSDIHVGSNRVAKLSYKAILRKYFRKFINGQEYFFNKCFPDQ